MSTLNNIEDKLTDAAGTISQRFLMLVQALSGIRGLTMLTMNKSNELDLLDDVLAVIKENLDVECCSIFLLDNNELTCVAFKNEDINRNNMLPDVHLGHTFKIGEGIVGQSAVNKELYHCRDCTADKNYLAVLNPQTESNSGSMICMPIMVGEELLGVLNLSHPEPYFFHQWQEHVVSIHANILAQMLYNHRLVKDMTSQVSSRTKELQISLAETESLKSKYKALSIIDDLTQIYNRRYFFSEVPSALARSLRYSQPLSLLFIDLDHFKIINDTYGHENGDHVLKDVAEVLSQQSRKGDILSRMGGEEFALAVPNTELEGIQNLALRIKDAVSELRWHYEDVTFGITLSMGISQLKLSTVNNKTSLNHVNDIVHILVREADDALYQSKSQGRNKITFYRDLKGPLDQA